MKYLVLGSSGQIGSALVNYLVDRGNEVETFDIVEDKYQDLRMQKNLVLLEKLHQSDFVFFLAFDVGGSRYLQRYQNTYKFIDNNMRIMANTFELLEKSKKPFVFASTQMSNMSYSSYGSLKKVGEWYTKILGGRIVKFWNVYGIEEDLEKSHVITDFVLKAKNNGIIDMLTDGTEDRQFLYSEDCCQALEIISNEYEKIDPDRELHITNHEWNTILEVAREVVKNFPAQIVPAKTKDMLQKNKKNEADPYILEFWKPSTSLSEGIRKICNYYKENEK
tara:strand:- start:1682 stop:2515 length:834 start_codon:yes stop_codon:yes gene_type:complete